MNTSYLFTALGMVFLTVIVGFIVPDGRMKRSVSFVLRLVCIFVLIQPVVGIFSYESSSGGYEVDYSYICNAYSESQSNFLTELINDEFSCDCVCRVEVIYTDGKITENGVAVTGNFSDEEIISRIVEYLEGLGYINITVNETA